MDEIKLVAATPKQFHAHITQVWRMVKDWKQDKALEITVKPWKRKRSNPQNSRLWAIHSQAAMAINMRLIESGNCTVKWTADDLHDRFKEMYCGTESSEINGKKLFKVKSSTEMNTEEMSNAQEQYVAYLQGELGIALEI